MTPTNSRAIVLLSGGIDSAVALAVAQREGFDAYALTFEYGQRHAAEIEAATLVAGSLGVVRHVTVALDRQVLAASALTGGSPTPPADGIPATYVPARNTIFLAHALAYAETVGATAIFIGANADDHDGYPDCRPAYFDAFERMANLATAAGITGRTVTIRRPLVDMTKAEVVTLGLGLDIDLALTHSCYRPDGARPCGDCDACQLRAAAFAANDMPDPAMVGQ